MLALVWGYAWVAIKVATQFSGPFTFAASRTVLAVLVLFAALVVRRQSLKPTPFGPTLVLGLLQTTLFMLAQITAVALGGAGKTAVLAYTMPFLTLLLAWPILGERIQKAGWASVVLSAAGLGFVLVPLDLSSGLLPKLLAVGGALVWAFSAIWLKLVRARYNVDLLSLTTWQMFWGVIPLIVLAFAVPERPVEFTAAFIASWLFVAIFGTALAWLLWMYVLSTLPAGTAGLATLATPIVGVLAAWAQLGERPSATEWIGIVLILSALGFLGANGRKRSAPSSS